MADPKTTENFEEQINLASRLRGILREQGAINEANRDVLNEIDSIENNILNSTNKLSGKKREVNNLQKDISDLTSVFNKEIERGNGHLTSTVDLVKEIGRKKNEELNLQKNISSEESLKAKLTDLYNELGLGKSLKYLEDFNKLARENPFAASLMVITGLLKVFKGIFDEIDSAAADFRITMGFIRSDTADIEQSVRNAHFDMYQTGVSAKELYGSLQAVSGAIGTWQAATAQVRDDIALMNKQLGISQDTSAEFATTMGMMGRSTMDAQKDMALFTSRLSAAAGTKLDDVMKDVAAKSETTYRFFVRNPLALAKAAVEARKMGTSLSAAADSASKLIKFTDSVKAEMEASVLLGESINLQRARELSYRKDLAGLNKEILSIAQKTRFEDLDPFQQEAVATALGKSSDQIGKMLQADREMSRIRRDGSLAKEVAEYDKLVASTNDIAKSTAESARNNLMNLSNQKSMQAISLALKSIYQTAFQPLVDLATWVLPKIASILQAIHSHTNKWVASIGGVLIVMGGLKVLGKAVSLVMGGVGKSVGNMLGGVAGGVRRFGTDSVIKGAFGLLLVATSLIPLAYALKLMQGVEWKTFAVMAASLGILVTAVLALGAIMMIPGLNVALLAGAAALFILSVSLIPAAFAFKLFGDAIKAMDGIDLLNMAAGLTAIAGAAYMLIPTAIFLPLLAGGFTALGLALMFANGPMERAGIATMELGLGLTRVANALEKIAGLSITQVLTQFKNLSETISGISREINAIPDIKIGKIQDIIVKSTGIAAQQNQKGNEEIVKALESVRIAVDNLRSSMEKGSIKANVNVAASTFDSGMARSLAFTGPKSPQPSYV